MTSNKTGRRRRVPTSADLIHRDRMFQKGMLWCNDCQDFRPIDDFAKSKSTRYGHHNLCRDCHRAKRDKTREHDYQQVNTRNRRLSAHFVNEAGGCCQRCGYDEAIAALDFHHINPEEKEYEPAYTVVSGNMELARRELDKCILICSNCHRAHRAGVWRCEYVKRDGLGWAIKKGSIVTTSFDDIGQLSDRYKYTQLGLKI